MFERALIVEDNESSRYYLKALLEAKGKLVETAANGEEALMRARRTRPQLLVSDLLMPVMDGFSLLIEWLEDPELNTIPFVVYTGTFTTEEDRQLALHIGANAFLVKPMEPDELMHSLEKTVVDFIPDRRVAAERKLEFSRRHADALVRKLTERNRELERERLARNREILEREALLDALHAGVAILDSRGRILRVNESWRRTARENDRASSTYGVGGSYFETIEGPDKNAIRASIEAVLNGELTSYFTDFPCHSKHRKCWFRMVVTPLRSSEAAAIVMHIDVSERKLLEEQLLRAQRLETIGNLAGGVAHDLNNSLAPITVAVDLLKAEIRDEAQLELLSSIEKSGTKGRDLVRQLLLFARGEARERRPVPLSDPLDEVYRLARDTFPERIKLHYEIDAGTEVVQADPTLSGISQSLPERSRCYRRRGVYRYQSRSGRTRRGRLPRLQARSPLHQSGVQRHGSRHLRNRHRANIRTFLHHQGVQSRHRTWAFDIQVHHRKSRRAHRARIADGSGGHIPSLSSGVSRARCRPFRRDPGPAANRPDDPRGRRRGHNSGSGRQTFGSSRLQGRRRGERLGGSQ